MARLRTNTKLKPAKKADLQVYLKSRIWEHVTFTDYVDWTSQLDSNNKILLPEWEEMILCMDSKVLITAPCDQGTRKFRAYDLHSRSTDPDVAYKKKKVFTLNYCRLGKVGITLPPRKQDQHAGNPYLLSWLT